MARTFSFQGQDQGARLINGQVVLALTNEPGLVWTYPATGTAAAKRAATAANKAEIKSSKAAAWLPSETVKTGDGRLARDDDQASGVRPDLPHGHRLRSRHRLARFPRPGHGLAEHRGHRDRQRRKRLRQCDRCLRSDHKLAGPGGLGLPVRQWRRLPDGAGLRGATVRVENHDGHLRLRHLQPSQPRIHRVGERARQPDRPVRHVGARRLSSSGDHQG